MSRSRRISAPLLVVAALAIASGAASTASGKAKHGAPVEIGTAKVAQLGTVLVRGSGHVLYMFQPLSITTVCNAACQRIWPPLLAPSHGAVKAIDGARQSLIGSVRDPVNGRRIVTYAGLPLYTYVLDKHPGQAGGQNVLLNGGYWWVLTPGGKINRKPVSHGGGYVGS